MCGKGDGAEIDQLDSKHEPASRCVCKENHHCSFTANAVFAVQKGQLACIFIIKTEVYYLFCDHFTCLCQRNAIFSLAEEPNGENKGNGMALSAWGSGITSETERKAPKEQAEDSRQSRQLWNSEIGKGKEESPGQPGEAG